MKKLLLLIGASARSQLRWARQHIYAWLVLGPLVLGMTCATAARVAHNIQGWEPSFALAVKLAVLIEASLIGLSLSRASAEIYHLRRPEHLFDALPVDAATHFHAAVLIRLARAAIVSIVALIARLIFSEAEIIDAAVLYSLALFVAITALAEVLAALNWIHWGHTREKLPALVAIIALVISVCAGGLLLTLIIKPALLSARSRFWIAASGAACAVALYALARSSHTRWRALDIEYARRIQTTISRSVFALRALRRWFDPVIAAQVARDLQLTLRAFSSAVYVAVGVAALWLVILVVALTTGSEFSAYLLPANVDTSGWFNATWLPSVMTIKLACVAAIVTLASLLPVLVAYELPHLWLERATGTTGLAIWQAKLWYTRLVSLPAPLACWLAGMLTGEAPLFYSLPLLAECLWLWWMTSSIAGSLSFEMPERAGLSIITMATIGLAGGLFSAMLWPFGLIIYFYSINSLVERGRHRARYYLIVEGD